MLGVGCAGSLLIAVTDSRSLVLVGGLLAIGIGSGWQGVFMHAYLRDATYVVRQSGIALATGGLGGAIGLITFTLVWQHAHISVAWLVNAVLYLAAAALLLRTVKRGMPRLVNASRPDARDATA